MSQNGYAKQPQLWQEGPVGDSVVIMCEIYTYGNDFDQVMYSTLHLACDTDNHTHFFFFMMFLILSGTDGGVD